MMRSLRFVSMAVCLALAACSSSRTSSGTTEQPPVIVLSQGEASQRYNLQLDFLKHHLSGMLLVRQMPGDEIRMVATTYFGMSLFDLSFREEQFVVNHCLEPMRKEKVLKLLETDFRHLFRGGNALHPATSKNRDTEQRTGGKGFGKSILTFSTDPPGDPEQITIRHPWLKLTLRLDKLRQ